MYKKKLMLLSILCGATQMTFANTYPQPRIINGDIVTVAQIPWQAAIVGSAEDSYQSYLCSATLIAERWVLTAAHCIEKLQATRQQGYILLGTINLQAKSEGQRIKIKQTYIHEQYDNHTFNNDIALIELAKSIDFGECGASCKTIAFLPPTMEQHYATINSFVQVAGWGALEDCQNNSQSEVCQKYAGQILRQPELYPTTLRTTTLKLSACVSPHSKYISEQVSKNMLCAEMPMQDSPTDTCFGDSGAGLTIQKERDKPYLLGVASWGMGCAKKGYAGVYTRVANYTDWIESYTLSDKNNDELKEKHAGSIGFVTVFILMGFGVIRGRLKR